MNNEITESSFAEEIESLARMAIDEYSLEDTDSDYYDAAHEIADSHNWVIYTYRAQQICNLPASIIDAGENWLEGVYETPYYGCETFAAVLTRLAYATLYTHLCEELYAQLKAIEEAA